MTTAVSWTQSVTDSAVSVLNCTTAALGRGWSWISSGVIDAGSWIVSVASSVHQFVVPRFVGFFSWMGQYPIQITVIAAIAVALGVAGNMLYTHLRT